MTEITTVVHAFEATDNRKTIKYKVAIINVFRHSDKTCRYKNNIEKRILKKLNKLMKSDGIRNVIILGNFLDTRIFTGFHKSNKLFLNFDESRMNTAEFKQVMQGSSLDADKWLEFVNIK